MTIKDLYPPGYDSRECTQHWPEHPTEEIRRLRCFDCSEWCTAAVPCRGCEIPILRQRIAQLEEHLRKQHLKVPEET